MLRLSLATRSLTRDLHEVIADLQVLSRSQRLKDYISTESPEARMRLEVAFTDTGESARRYHQIRLIDRAGWEKVRVNFHAGGAITVPAEQLQDKSQRYYVKHALALKAGQIYISRLDLNVEQGRIEQPFKPVIRVATPVTDAAGNLKGILVLNYLAQEVLNDFQNIMAGSWGEANLVTAWGDWLYSPDKQDEWGFMLGHERTFAFRYPEAWRHIAQNESGKVETAAGLFLFDTDRPYDAILKDFAGSNISERQWKLIERIAPHAFVYSPWAALRAKLGTLSQLLLLAGILSSLLAILRTQYVATARAFRESEHRLAEAQQLTHVGNWVWEIPSGNLSWSEETYRIFGLRSEEEIDYEKFISMVHPEDRGAVAKAIGEALRDNTRYDIDHRIVRADGSVRIVHERGSVTLGQSGVPVRMLGTIQDITERKTIEEKLRDSEERFRQLAENIEDVFWLTDWPQNRVMYVSPAFERIWGLAAQELYENPMLWILVIVEEDRARAEKEFLRSASGGFDISYRIRRPDGTMRWIHDRGFQIYDSNGVVYRVAGVATDITKRVQIEQELHSHKEHLEELVAERTAELQASVQDLESFNYSLAHDLRTPLRAVTSFSQILTQEAASKLTAEEQDQLHRITRAGKHMALLLDGMSELGLISRKKMHYCDVDLSAIAQQIMDQLRLEQPQPSTQVQISPHLHCRGDAELLSRALRYLLEHAWKNTSGRAPASIEFGVTTRDGAQVYFVRDNGRGFDRSLAERLFEPFQHLHADDDPQGTGIGLAAAHRIVQRHRGKLWAEAQDDSGTAFYFSVPEPKPDAPGVS